MSLGLKYVALGDSVNAVLQETYNLYLTHFSNYLKKYCQDFNSNILMALKIEVQTLTINFCSSVDPLWICMKSKYPKSRKIQNRITSFEFMSPFHWNIAILNNVFFLIFVYVLILVMFWFWWCLFLFRECYSSLIPALTWFLFRRKHILFIDAFQKQIYQCLLQCFSTKYLLMFLEENQVSVFLEMCLLVSSFLGANTNIHSLGGVPENCQFSPISYCTVGH